MGALTLKKLSFKIRSWELSYTDYPNFFDNNFGLITIQKRGNEIIRILPSRHDAYYWITNKTRFYFEKLKIQRLVFPFIQEQKNFIKVKWPKIIKFLRYLRKVQSISTMIGPLSNFYRHKQFGNLSFFNNTYSSLDFLSNFLFKKLYNLNNTVSSITNQNSYIGNSTLNYLNIFDFEPNKINIFNNINIVQELPRIWSNLKINNINYYIGSKKCVNIFLFQIANSLNIIVNKTVLLLLNDKILIYTEEKLDINFKQIIFKNNSKFDYYSSLWFDQKATYGLLNNEHLYFYFNTNNNRFKKTGINFNFQSYGNLPLNKYSLYLPTSTILEEKKLLLDGYGNLQTLNRLITRKIQVRSLIQFSWIFNLIFNYTQKNSFKYKKQIKQTHLKNLTLVENIILLLFGRLENTFRNNNDLSSILLTKQKKIFNSLNIVPELEMNNQKSVIHKTNY